MLAWMNNAVPNWAQWIGLFGTLVGAGFSLWGVFSARSAKQQASLARQAALRIGHITRIEDIIGEMRELEIFIARKDMELIAMKCNQLRSRVARFKPDAYNQLS